MQFEQSSCWTRLSERSKKIKTKQKHKITLIIVYLVKKKKKENINHNLYVTWTKQLTTMTEKKLLEKDLLGP